MKSRLFIGSSKESLHIANAVHQNLSRDAEVTVWNQGVFELSTTTLESLFDILDNSDFSIFIFSPDDLVTIRERQSQAVRDNVIFELGLFIGHLRKNRCYIIVPENTPDLRIPTDLIGINLGEYEINRSDNNFESATAPVCNSIRKIMHRIGLRATEPESPNEIPELTEKASSRKFIEKQQAEPKTDVIDFRWLDAFFDNKYKESIGLLKEKLSCETNDSDIVFFKSWLAAAEYHLNPATGLKIFEELFSKYPISETPYVILSSLYMEESLHPECLKIIETGLPKVSNKSALIRLKARCLHEMGRDKDALDTLLNGISRFNDVPENYESLADYYIDHEQYSSARECLEEGLSILPDNLTLLSKYGILLYNHISKKLALIPYNKLVELFPEEYQFFCLRANIYLELELNDLAMNDYKKANELAKHEQGWVIANIGNLQSNRGFYREAIASLQQALSIKPENQYALERLAKAIKLRDEEENKLTEIVKEAKRELLALRSTEDKIQEDSAS
ncbi:TIR domain-containing protein [Chloroflexota bacterium]